MTSSDYMTVQSEENPSLSISLYTLVSTFGAFTKFTKGLATNQNVQKIERQISKL